jgi:hypothetical protein
MKILLKSGKVRDKQLLWLRLSKQVETSNVTSQIKDCILGKQKTAFGYKWKYK